jgi:hypothetical protein
MGGHVAPRASDTLEELGEQPSIATTPGAVHADDSPRQSEGEATGAAAPGRAFAARRDQQANYSTC